MVKMSYSYPIRDTLVKSPFTLCTKISVVLSQIWTIHLSDYYSNIRFIVNSGSTCSCGQYIRVNDLWCKTCCEFRKYNWSLFYLVTILTYCIGHNWEMWWKDPFLNSQKTPRISPSWSSYSYSSTMRVRYVVSVLGGNYPCNNGTQL